MSDEAAWIHPCRFCSYVTERILLAKRAVPPHMKALANISANISASIQGQHTGHLLGQAGQGTGKEME